MHSTPEPRRRPPLDRPVAPARAAGHAGSACSDPATRTAQALLDDLGLDLAVPGPGEARSPALEWALSGAMALTGDPAGAPRFARGPLASAARGAGRALAALVPGRGFEDLDGPALLAERAALFGFTRQGSASCGGSARLLPTRRGWLALNLPRDDDWALLPAWLESALPDIEQTRDWSAVGRALAERDREPLVARGREMGLAVAPAPRRSMGTSARPQAPFRLAHASFGVPSAAPTHARSRPRVLDLSTLWAGPLAGSLLAQAGCEVLKVESPRRPDGARLGEQRFFSLLNGNKHGCALDLTDRSDRDLFARLLESTDIVLESARPRALAQLGFDARAWVESRPGRIWASITGYGREHEWIAFGDDAAAAAGLAFDPDSDSDRSRPRFCADAIADPLTGLIAAVAMLGLHARGRGGLLSLALAEVAAWAAEPVYANDDPVEDPAEIASHNDADRRVATLTLPLEERRSAWGVVDASGWTAVAAPRARPGDGRAPALAAPTKALVDRWTDAC